jgi:hypothetical protein
MSQRGTSIDQLVQSASHLGGEVISFGGVVARSRRVRLVRGGRRKRWQLDGGGDGDVIRDGRWRKEWGDGERGHELIEVARNSDEVELLG